VFAGCSKLFLLTGNSENAAELQRHALTAARQAGSLRWLKASAFWRVAHSNSMIGRMHYRIETELQESGLAWTMLRPHHFMQNLLGQADNIIKDDVVYSSSGDGKIPFVDTRDIAGVAVVTLTHRGTPRRSTSSRGVKAISYRQATAILGQAIARPLRFIDEPFDEARARLTGAGPTSVAGRQPARNLGVSARGRSDRDDHQRGRRSDRETATPRSRSSPRLRGRISASLSMSETHSHEVNFGSSPSTKSPRTSRTSKARHPCSSMSAHRWAMAEARMPQWF